MADPTLKRTSVQINYTASDGYRAEVGYSSARSGAPESVFIEAVDELSRLCHLFGFGDKAREAFDNAAKRVNEWRGIEHPPAPVDRASIGDTPAPQSTDGGDGNCLMQGGEIAPSNQAAVKHPSSNAGVEEADRGR